MCFNWRSCDLFVSLYAVLMSDFAYYSGVILFFDMGNESMLIFQFGDWIVLRFLNQCFGSYFIVYYHKSRELEEGKFDRFEFFCINKYSIIHQSKAKRLNVYNCELKRKLFLHF